ncbi:MAG: prolyl oligopeptidase family serine peptidase [Bacteroidales bacterium]|nr:prolyl oligopeptidase family serine peptidase [Bacteroidales bacterium]MDD4671033.1 prolyl oligopeptidase family serine peptidase [Bacteroidales bacterium]
MKHLLLFILGLTVLSSHLTYGQDIEYQQPPKEVIEIVMAKPMPTTLFSYGYGKAVVLQRDCALVPLKKLADDELRIGGLRINPDNFSETRGSFSNSLYLMDVATGKTTQIGNMPENAEIKEVQWSPSDKYFCFLNVTEKEVELYRVDATAAEPRAEKINTLKVNSIFGSAYTFIDDETIIYKSVPANIKEAPVKTLPSGPVVQESLGKKKALRTTQDLLTSPYDAVLYDYYCTSVFAVFSQEGTKTIGKNAIFRSYNMSPDRQYMMVTTEHRPYSYMEGHNSFTSKLEIWDINGNNIKMLRDGTIKKDDDGDKDDKAPEEPSKSGYSWRADKPATLTWIESDNGEGEMMGRFGMMTPADDDKDKEKDKPEKTYTSRLYQCDAPFNFEDKVLVLNPEYRLGQITWGNDKIAVYTDMSSKQKLRRTITFVPCDTLAKRNILFTESTDTDTLGNFPVYGKIYTVRNQYNSRVMYIDKKISYIYLADTKRPDENGDQMSFIDKLTLKNGKIENLWMGAAPYQERVIAITDFAKLKFISERQSRTEVPNYYVVDVKGKKSRQITFFENTMPIMDGITKQFVTYKRDDGLTLCANLYLPAGYDKERDGKLPVLMWGYPYEYKCFAEAEKVRPPRYNFVRPNYGSAIVWATQGYAILDGFSMPIVASDKDKEPNDVFISQLVMNAEAAINFVDSIGVGDRDRVAVSGHSYGGFMTANLLAHTKLFRAGIARSGAYNRSLTPFGFQSERRNYWKAKSIYDTMSPFTYADKLKTPILLIHGQMDNNSGTFPIQSERLYQALVGLGGTARYLQLPYESHGYSAIENVLHMVYETGRWLDTYLSKEAVEKAKAKEKK